MTYLAPLRRYFQHTKEVNFVCISVFEVLEINCRQLFTSNPQELMKDPRAWLIGILSALRLPTTDIEKQLKQMSIDSQVHSAISFGNDSLRTSGRKRTLTNESCTYKRNGEASSKSTST